MKAYNEIKKELEARKDRSAWNKGVTVYALELLEEYQERAAYEGREAADRAEFKAWLLNGADSWESYSYGGCSLMDNSMIASALVPFLVPEITELISVLSVTIPRKVS